MSSNLPPSELVHQAYQPFPRLSYPLVDENRIVSPGWYRFLLTIWKKTGGTVSSLPGTLFLTVNAAGQIVASSAADGQPVADIPVVPPVNPKPPQVLHPTASPFIYTALVAGTLLCSGGQLEFARGPLGTFYPVGLTGGALPLLVGDRARVTWFGIAPPPLTWLPSL